MNRFLRIDSSSVLDSGAETQYNLPQEALVVACSRHQPHLMIGEGRYEQWNVPTVNMKTAMACAIAATVAEL